MKIFSRLKEKKNEKKNYCYYPSIAGGRMRSPPSPAPPHNLRAPPASGDSAHS